MEVLEVLVEAEPAFHKSSAKTADCPWPWFQRPVFKGNFVFIHLILINLLPGFSFHVWTQIFKMKYAETLSIDDGTHLEKRPFFRLYAPIKGDRTIPTER